MTSPTSSFGALGVPHPLVEALALLGVTEPFPIQAATLPDTLAGRDVLGRGRTGSGKTIAFGLPLIARLGSRLAGAARPGRPLGLVLAPTRELATQIEQTLIPLADAYGLTTTTIFGGVSPARQIAALTRGVDIVVACPGRLEDLMRQGHVRLDAIEITVIDEADHMADLGFLPGVTRILAATPGGGQRMLFSATLDDGVGKLATRFLHSPVSHGADAPEIPAAAMEHHVFTVTDASAKRRTVEELASGLGRRVLFVRTKHTAKRWARDLTAAGIPSVDLHGNLSQGQRDRNLEAFASGRTRVLVATDVAARGVHVDDVELVVHVDPPAEHKAYLHRSGRTARAGKDGAVVTLVLPEQRGDVAAMMRKAGIRVEPQPAADSAAVRDLVGEVAPRVAPVAVATPAHTAQAGGGRGQRGGQQSGQRQQSRGGHSRTGQTERPARGGQPARDGASASDSPRSGAPRNGSSRRRRRPASRA